MDNKDMEMMVNRLIEALDKFAGLVDEFDAKRKKKNVKSTQPKEITKTVDVHKETQNSEIFKYLYNGYTIKDVKPINEYWNRFTFVKEVK